MAFSTVSTASSEASTFSRLMAVWKSTLDSASGSPAMVS